MTRLKQRITQTAMTQTENIPLSLFELPRSYNESIISDLNFGSDKMSLDHTMSYHGCCYSVIVITLAATGEHDYILEIIRRTYYCKTNGSTKIHTSVG